MWEILSNPWDHLAYEPIYNLVIFLSNNVADLGIVVILTTIIIKIILFPLFDKQINNQIATKKAKPELDALAKKYKGKKLTKEESQKKVKETLELYKEFNLKPFSAILLLIIQIPIIFALYWIFYKGGLPEIDKTIVYDFIKIPENISMSFLNYFDLTKSYYSLAIIAAITQFWHLSISMPDVSFSDLKKKGKGISEDMMNSFQINIKYGLPVLIFIMLITVFDTSAIAIYWITSNIFMTIQEYFVREKKKNLRAK